MIYRHKKPDAYHSTQLIFEMGRIYVHWAILSFYWPAPLDILSPAPPLFCLLIPEPRMATESRFQENGSLIPIISFRDRTQKKEEFLEEKKLLFWVASTKLIPYKKNCCLPRTFSFLFFFFARIPTFSHCAYLYTPN